MARRITAEHAEILVQDTATVSARITAIHANFLLSASSVLPADNLNSWGDAVTLDFLAPAEALSKTASDSLFNYADGVNLVLLPEGPLQINVNSLNTFNADFAALGTGHLFSDTLSNWADAVAIADGFRKEAFDSMFFNIGDAAEVLLFAHLTISSGSTLNSWLDAALTNNASNPVPPLEDTLSQVDSTTLRFGYLPAFTDALTLSDANIVVIGIGFAVSDDVNNWSDAAVVAMVIAGSVNASDTLSMSDAVSTLINTTLTNYLRRYLNDVVN